jgi:hypothetical protein
MAGKLDTFFVQGPDVGSISSIQLQCQGGGLTAAWHLSSVTVTNSSSGQVARFAYNDWFDKSKVWMQVRVWCFVCVVLAINQVAAAMCAA